MITKADQRDFLQAMQRGIHKGEHVRKLECFRYLFQNAPEFNAVFELFGGVGALWRVLEELGKATEYTAHETWEISPGCVAELKRQFPRGHRIRLTDSFTTQLPVLGGSSVLVSLDFNTFTPLRAAREPRFLHLLGRVFSMLPGFVHITDSAPNKLHLNAGHYSRFFGRDVQDVDSYARATSAWFLARYNYRINRAVYHSNALYYLLQPCGRFPASIPKVR